MKKIILAVVIGLVVLVVGAALAVHLFLDGAVRRGVVTVGPMLTKTEVKLDSVSLSLLSGGGKIKGLVIGNPEGYKTPAAISVGTATLAVQPGSLLSDKVVVKTVNVEAPEITFETDLKGNNLSKILANLEAATGGTETAPAAKQESASTRKLQVDEFVVTGGKVHVSVTALGGKSATVPLPEIRLSNLGQGEDGITAAELTKRVLQEVLKGSIQAASGAVADLGKSVGDLGKDLGAGAAEKVKGIGDLFKKKQ